MFGHKRIAHLEQQLTDALDRAHKAESYAASVESGRSVLETSFTHLSDRQNDALDQCATWAKSGNSVYRKAARVFADILNGQAPPTPEPRKPAKKAHRMNCRA